jgi:hypothetical protein
MTSPNMVTDAMAERFKKLFAAAHEADDCHQPLECDPRDIIALETEMRHFEVAMQSSQPTDDVERVAQAIEKIIDDYPMIDASQSQIRKIRAEKIARAAIAALSGGQVE